MNAIQQRYASVAESLIKMMEGGTVPWRRTWKDQVSPCNPVSGTVFQGFNRLVLTAQTRERPFYLTYNQAADQGGHVKRGAKGLPIVFYKFNQTAKSLSDEIAEPGSSESPDEKAGRNSGAKKQFTGPLFRYYTVFNIDDTEGLEHLKLPDLSVKEFTPDERHARAEEIAQQFSQTVCPVLHGGSSCCYYPSKDVIQMAPKGQFESLEAYYATLFHETIHATGHSTRLDRPMSVDKSSEEYAKEELVAEIGSAFLCADAQMNMPDLGANAAAYLSHWLGRIKEKPSILVSAANQATKAVGWILKPEQRIDQKQEQESALAPKPLSEEQKAAKAQIEGFTQEPSLVR